MGLDGGHSSGIPKSSSVSSKEEFPPLELFDDGFGELGGEGDSSGDVGSGGEGDASGDCSRVWPGDVEFGGEGDGSGDVSGVVAGNIDCDGWETNGEGRVQDFAEN